ncbi:MAG TPA: class I SAM-dependent methyltransferase [Polyangiaceae bacterium]|nr:class I SAM-dependent methyltransferase [Polyangiaceae bacterium]
MPHEWPLDPHSFSKYYAFAPTALALRECIRLQAVRHLELPEPILDVGCGDGVFARLAYPGKQTWGIDINPTELQRAQGTHSYSTLICGNISTVDLPPQFFGSAIANCSLEHVPDLRAALRNVRSALKPGAPLVLIVPTPTWTRRLALTEALGKAGLHSLGNAWGELLDHVFRHVHRIDAATWMRHLEACGFEACEVTMIAQRGVSWAFDILLWPSLVGFLNKKLTGRWVLLPRLRFLTSDLMRISLNALASRVPDAEEAAEYLIVCKARP